MTKDKDLKRRIRARMEKTGESYTAARANLLRKKPLPIRDDYAELAGMSDDVVAEKTGRTWPEWVRALDEIGAMEMPHRDIATWVDAEIGLSWWAQTVTVGYERIRGLRDVGQRRDGAYEIGKSRTIGVAVEALYRAVAEEEGRRGWLDVDHLEVRAATPHKSVRITWPDGTSVEAYFTDKGPSKSTLTVQHTKLESKEAGEELKVYWGERLDALKALLE